MRASSKHLWDYSMTTFYRYGKEVVNESHLLKAGLLFGEAQEISKFIPYVAVPDDKFTGCIQLYPVIEDRRFPIIHGVSGVNSFSLGTHFAQVELIDTRTEPNKNLIITENGVIETIVGPVLTLGNLGLTSSYKLATYDGMDDEDGLTCSYIINADGKKVKSDDSFLNVTYIGSGTYLLTRYIEMGEHTPKTKKFDIINYNLTKHIKNIPAISEVGDLLGLRIAMLSRREHIDKLEIKANPLLKSNQEVLNKMLKIRDKVLESEK